MQLFVSKTLIFLFFLSLNILLFAQSFEIQSPLDIPLYLSGNFAELRSTHFHAGIDIKTQGEVGKNVYAISPGYVSRVKIQTGGYGHSIYITHSSGYTSVYAHLNEFFPELEQYVKNEQYRQKKFEVDVYLNESKFPVNSRQFIGVSGNTGSSGGPHLHLEIRDKDEVPLNVLKFGFPIIDSISPAFRNLYIYNNIDKHTYQWTKKDIIPVAENGKNFIIKKPLEVKGLAGFGIEVYDYLNGSQNKCGVYSLDFIIDEKLIHSVRFEKVSFNEAGYIKSYVDYEEKILNGNGIHRLFIETNNKLSVYKITFGNGLVFLDDTLIHNAKIIAGDVYGNKSELNFKLFFKPESSLLLIDSNNVFLNYNRENNIVNSTMKFKIPVGALYADKSIRFKIFAPQKNYFSFIYKIGEEFIPMHKYPNLSLKVITDSLSINPEKLVIIRIDTTGSVKSEGGIYNHGWVTANVTGFGKYAIVADTTSPEISSITFIENNWYGKSDIISFKIKDELSGIKTYNGYIDNEWALFEYDAKTDSIFYKIDSERIKREKDAHLLELFIMDERNNMKKFSGNFYF